MPEYLLEIRCQELPVRQLRRGTELLAGRLFEDLMGQGLAPKEILTGATRRRLAVGLIGLPESGPDHVQSSLGPPLQDAYDEQEEPTAALLGFAERVGQGLDELTTVRTERGEYIAAEQHRAGRPVREVLLERIPRVLAELPWKGSDRWRPRPGGWPSPVVGLVSVLDGTLLPIELEGVQASAETRGHPVMSPQSIPVAGFADYREQLRQLGVIVSWQQRRTLLQELLEARAGEVRGQIEGDESLIDELTAFCEIPGVVRGGFEPEYLNLPDEVILVSLAEHGALALRGRDGLLPYFLAVMDRADDPRGLVLAGHQRAVTGRLADARYHFEADRALTMAERARQLELVSFHPRLGSWAAKVERVRLLLELMCEELGWAEEKETVLQAVALCKADLTSNLVREFPSLRGTLGGVVARHEGYIEGVWQAIADQYKPAGGKAEIPRQRAGRLLALADRLDSLVGFLGIGEGSKTGQDLPAVRRLASGLLRILIEGEIPVDLELVAARAVLLYGETLDRDATDLLADLVAVIEDRLTRLLGQRGFHFDEIEAGMAVGRKDLPDLVARLEALRTARGESEFRSLVRSAKRISNLVDGEPEFEIDTESLEEEAEIALAEQLAEVRPLVDEAVATRRYGECLTRLAALVPTIERFFADVLVMDENQRRRQNRIALLQACRRVFWKVARLKALGVDRIEGS